METPVWGDTFWKALWKQLPSQLSYKPQLFKSRGTQSGIRYFFPTPLINERLLCKPRQASLKPWSCAVTFSWFLAPTEIITEGYARKSQSCHLHSGWEWQACQEKSVQAFPVLPQCPRLEDRIRYQPHLPPATWPWSWVIVLPKPRGFPCQVVMIMNTCLPHLIIWGFNEFHFHKVWLYPW